MEINHLPIRNGRQPGPEGSGRTMPGGGLLIEGSMNLFDFESTGCAAEGGRSAFSAGGGARMAGAGGSGLVRLVNRTISGNSATGGSGGGLPSNTDGFASGGGLSRENPAPGLNIIAEFRTL